MIRPSLLLVGAVLAGSPGCAPMEGAPPRSAAAVGRAAPVPSLGSPSGTAAPSSRVAGDRAAQMEACRRDAERIVLYRDRGQLMREDERDARIGTDSSIYARRTETDRLGRAFERDRIAAECLQQDARPPSPRR